MSSVLIVGYGVVGRNLHTEINALNPHIYDKYARANNTREDGMAYDFAFICVDTPFVSTDNPCDLTEVENAIKENDAGVYIVKSAILPGSAEELTSRTGKRLVVSPEYYGNTQHCNNFEFSFTILGGAREDCISVVQLLQGVYDGRHSFRMTDFKTAELVKYMENSYLATKVSFCVQFFHIAESLGVSYEELRELFVLDPRVGASHSFVYRQHPFWSSHCLNKDVAAIAVSQSALFLVNLMKFNEMCKEQVNKK